MHHTSNDNAETPEAADPMGGGGHGQAAMLLVESLIHSLIARNILSVADAVEIMDVALDVGQETDTPTAQHANALLAAINSSLKLDLRE